MLRIRRSSWGYLPRGMFELGFARPIVMYTDFETGHLRTMFSEV